MRNFLIMVVFILCTPCYTLAFQKLIKGPLDYYQKWTNPEVALEYIGSNKTQTLLGDLNQLEKTYQGLPLAEASAETLRRAGDRVHVVINAAIHFLQHDQTTQIEQLLTTTPPAFMTPYIRDLMVIRLRKKNETLNNTNQNLAQFLGPQPLPAAQAGEIEELKKQNLLLMAQLELIIKERDARPDNPSSTKPSPAPSGTSSPSSSRRPSISLPPGSKSLLGQQQTLQPPASDTLTDQEADGQEPDEDPNNEQGDQD